MSSSQVKLMIDGNTLEAPRGMLLVDAALRAGIDVPVFCYHPKMEPVGMCRMCLVEIGRPSRDRQSGEFLLDENDQPIINFGPNLETACTTRIDEGWVVYINSERALEGQKQIVEFLLTSHPLDCPVCDKGGECPLQDLTMLHGPGISRFSFHDKMNSLKRVALGELIILDRERCIQCARCIRFQEEIVDDPVIEFSNRGRSLEIVTFSEPGFDSYFSGNTTDICPVGALTTSDFRFGSRPWELNAAASICPHCPVGCNIILNTRREVKMGGSEIVKRVLPRQNEMINEIWICDKGRFAYSYAMDSERLSQPMIRVGGELEETSWDNALKVAAEGLKQSGANLLGLAGGRASNEDLYNFKQLIQGLDGVSMLNDFMAGGKQNQQIGLGPGSNLGDLGVGDAIVVIASDLLEEAPIWWLRVKQAAERGAKLIVANARFTKLEKYSAHTVRYSFGDAPETVLGMLHYVTGDSSLNKYAKVDGQEESARIIKEATNAVLFMGSEGSDSESSKRLVQACGSLLAATEHIGKANNGLIPVWLKNNTQGAWDMGLTPPEKHLAEEFRDRTALYLMACDPFGDNPEMLQELPQDAFVIVQELFHTPSVDRADVVFPAQSFIERDGTLTSGERVVQLFYPAVSPHGESLPDWKILARIGALLGVAMESTSAAGVMNRIAEDIEDYGEIHYRELMNREDQWPPVGGKQIYFGGTAYENSQGIGIRLSSRAQRGEAYEPVWKESPKKPKSEGIRIVPIVKLYDQGTTVLPSLLLAQRIGQPELVIGQEDADRLLLQNGAQVEVQWNGTAHQFPVAIDNDIPEGIVLLPRNRQLGLEMPMACNLTPVKPTSKEKGE